MSIVVKFLITNSWIRGHRAKDIEGYVTVHVAVRFQGVEPVECGMPNLKKYFVVVLGYIDANLPRFVIQQQEFPGILHALVAHSGEIVRVLVEICRGVVEVARLGNHVTIRRVGHQ